MMSARTRTNLTAIGVLSMTAIALSVAAQSEQVSPDASPIAMPPGGPAAAAAAGAEAPEFPPFETVSKNLEKVVSVADGSKSFYTLYANKKDGSLIAELPKDFEGKLVMVAPTVAGGDQEAGVMGGTIYGCWKRIDKSLVLMEPNFIVRSTGDKESQTSIKQLFTDRVILDVPIAAMGPGGGPVIDLKNLFIAQAPKWFTPFFGGYGPTLRGMNPRLLTLESAKAFPHNIEVRYQVPDGQGQLISLHYSIRDLPENSTYKPREADSRVGFFNVYYRDLGKSGADEPYTRYITRWQLEKADPKLKLSPPKQPIVWYIEHTTPVRYRRFVREGILAWNKAFEQCGIVNAMEVYQQDASTGEHMDKDPEDCRYNFFRWNTSEQGYAIGPSREDPRTGQTLDADVVWHAGLTNAVIDMLKELSGSMATISFTPETLSWLEEHPEYDPRIRLAPPGKRDQLMAQANARLAGHAAPIACDHEYPLSSTCAAGSHSAQAWNNQGAACRIGEYLAMNINLFAAAMAGGILADPSPDASTLDGMPEDFLGPMIRYISSHEVGHCLGLQHNFSASTVRSLKDMNSKEFGSQPSVGSVMEYAGVNINFGDGDVQGPYATPTIGPYDMWAIQFGYGPEEDRAKILSRVGEPDLVFHNDLAMQGPDPRVMVWDIGADSLEFCDSRMRIVRDLRGKIITELVKDGQPWRKARERYISLLNTQMQTVYVASRWIGGSYNNRDFKGDPGNRAFIENVPADRQRRALDFILNNALRDDAYGLTPELVQHLGLQFYYDEPGTANAIMDPSFEVHDMVAGVQATALTMIMNPTTLRRIYDNEYRTNGSEPNPITLAEVMNSVSDSVWSDVKSTGGAKYSPAKPMLSSFRRNLQREHLDRLVTLSLPKPTNSPAQRTIATLSTLKLRQISDRIKPILSSANVDEYTVAHLTDAQARIEKALNAQYVITR